MNSLVRLGENCTLELKQKNIFPEKVLRERKRHRKNRRRENSGVEMKGNLSLTKKLPNDFR